MVPKREHKTEGWMPFGDYSKQYRSWKAEDGGAYMQWRDTPKGVWIKEKYNKREYKISFTGLVEFKKGDAMKLYEVVVFTNIKDGINYVPTVVVPVTPIFAKDDCHAKQLAATLISQEHRVNFEKGNLEVLVRPFV